MLRLFRSWSGSIIYLQVVVANPVPLEIWGHCPQVSFAIAHMTDNLLIIPGGVHIEDIEHISKGGKHIGIGEYTSSTGIEGEYTSSSK